MVPGLPLFDLPPWIMFMCACADKLWATVSASVNPTIVRCMQTATLVPIWVGCALIVLAVSRLASLLISKRIFLLDLTRFSHAVILSALATAAALPLHVEAAYYLEFPFVFIRYGTCDTIPVIVCFDKKGNMAEFNEWSPLTKRFAFCKDVTFAAPVCSAAVTLYTTLTNVRLDRYLNTKRSARRTVCWAERSA